MLYAVCMHAGLAVISCILPCSTSKPQLGQPRKIGEGCRFNSITTNTFKLHFFESPSGIKVGGSISELFCPSSCFPGMSYPVSPSSACRLYSTQVATWVIFVSF